MARPTRQGVDYFPLDIHLDDKFKFIQIKYGLEGFAVIVKLLQKIYSYGYWYQWGEDERLIFSHEEGIDKEDLDNILSEAINREVFNKEMFDKYNILTSAGIQKRYQAIVKRRKNVELITEYLLIEGKFGEDDNIMSVECIHDVDIVNTDSKQDVNKSTQSKVKESRVNIYNDFFEEVWSLYPNKKGKGTISDTKKKEIYKIGEEFKRCISRYKKYVEQERAKRFKDLQYQNGSTFFNSGYVDYLDENVKDKESKKKKLQERPPLKVVYRKL